MEVIVGVLALQGAFSKHISMLQKLGTKCLEVRTLAHLQSCDALIIPGGESTALTRQLRDTKLNEAIVSFGETHPIFGTCAGAILMAQSIENPGSAEPLSLIDYTIKRNAFGRQNDSSIEHLEIPSIKASLKGFFIRAPQITKVNSSVQILSEHPEKGPVLISNGKHLAATFHPELGSCHSIHQYFIKHFVIQSKQRSLQLSL